MVGVNPPAATAIETAAVAWRRLLNFSHQGQPQSREIHLSFDNLKDNYHWGDELGPKPEGTTRIYAANVNGFQLDARGGKFAKFCGVIKEIQADIAGVAEHNLDTTKYYVRSVCKSAANTLNTPRLDLSSSTIESVNLYKPGGTLLLSSSSIVARLQDHGNDPLGRWSFQTFQGKQGRQVTIIMCYQVCHDGARKGTTTAAAQQRALLNQRGDSDPDPRRSFCRDLKQLLRKKTGPNKEVLVMGDFNESIDDVTCGISKLLTCNDFAMEDLMYRLHGSTKIATYARGRKRIDYAYGTRGIVESLVHGGYEAFGHRLYTDHRAYYFNLDTQLLFGNETPDMPGLQHRLLQSKCPQQVTTYLDALDPMIASRNVLERSRQLLDSDAPDHDLAERLDRDMLQFCLSAAKKCRQFREPQWSQKLDRLRAKVGILQRAISLCRTHRNHMDKIRTLREKYGADYVIPDTLTAIRMALKEAKKECSAV